MTDDERLHRVTITCEAADGSRIFDEVRAQCGDVVSGDSSLMVNGSEALVEVFTIEPHRIVEMTLIKLLATRVNIAQV